MTDWSPFIVAVSVVSIFAVFFMSGFYMGYLFRRMSDKKRATKEGRAHYDPKTGEFKWGSLP